MLNQVYYSVRNRLFMRVVSLLTVAGVHVFFLPFALRENAHPGAMITAVTFSSLALAFAVIVNMAVSFSGIYEAFSAPKGYAGLLVPVASWKLLLAKILPAAVMDALIVSGAILSTVWYSFALADLRGTGLISAMDVFWAIMSGLGGYLFLLTAFAFAVVLAKSAFYRLRLRGLLAFLVTCLFLWALSWLNLLLLPFGQLQSVWLLYNIHIAPGTPGAAIYILLFWVQAAILFLAAARLMERKINI